MGGGGGGVFEIQRALFRGRFLRCPYFASFGGEHVAAWRPEMCCVETRQGTVWETEKVLRGIPDRALCWRIMQNVETLTQLVEPCKKC